MKYYTISTPRYFIKRKDEEVFDVFNTKNKAIETAIEMALSYPNNEFRVFKDVNRKEKEIFAISMNVRCDLSIRKTFFERAIELFKKKLQSIQYWRF